MSEEKYREMRWIDTRPSFSWIQKYKEANEDYSMEEMLADYNQCSLQEVRTFLNASKIEQKLAFANR